MVKSVHRDNGFPGAALYVKQPLVHHEFNSRFERKVDYHHRAGGSLFKTMSGH